MSDAGTESSSAGRVATDREPRPVSERRPWLAVARKDFLDAARAWQLYALGAAFLTALLLGGLNPVLTDLATRGEALPHTAREGLVGMASLAGTVVPLVALLLGYVAVTGEFERGSLRTLLAFPVSRRDVVLGTLLGRTAAVETTLALGLAVALVPMWLVYGGVDVLVYVGFSASLLLFGACYVAMAVGISAASRTRGRALGWTMTAFALTTVLWQTLLGLVRAATGVSTVIYNTEADKAPGWYVFLERVQPEMAWRVVVTDWLVPLFDEKGLGETVHYISPTTPGPEPFYLDSWVLVLVLLAWGGVPLAIGFWRFRRVDVA